MPKRQNFAVPSNNDALIDVDVATEVSGETLANATVEWSVYPQLHGVVTDTTPIISKTSASPGGGISIPTSPDMTFIIDLSATDTITLLGNYYHEATIIDALGDRDTVMYGQMCVTQSINP